MKKSEYDEFINSNIAYVIKSYAISLLYHGVSNLLRSRDIEELKYNLGYIDALKDFISLNFLENINFVEDYSNNIIEFNKITKDYIDKITKLIGGKK